VTLKKIRRALSLMQEFGRRVDTVLADDPDGHFIVGTAATGALRRTSMELTWALADPAEAWVPRGRFRLYMPSTQPGDGA
jgi:hypothetical protein